MLDRAQELHKKKNSALLFLPNLGLGRHAVIIKAAIRTIPGPLLQPQAA